jgi:hypothetical protein
MAMGPFSVTILVLYIKKYCDDFGTGILVQEPRYWRRTVMEVIKDM